MSKQKLLLIDGNSILNRAFFALPFLSDNQGRNVNAVYGFLNIFLKCIQDYSPDKVVVAFDMRGHNFRKDLYTEYMANRKGMPDDLAAQMPVLEEILHLMKVAVVKKPGVEADDIIGTISSHFEGESIIISGDRDMLQLVSNQVTVLLTKRGVPEVETVTPSYLQEVYHLTPKQIIEYKALRGDTSDNIPGVKGVGEKTAMQLLEKYGDIDNIYANIDQQKGALKDKLVNDKEMAFVSRQLATIVTSADVDYNFDICTLPIFDTQVKQRLEQLQFKSILVRLSFDESSVEETIQVETVQVKTCSQLEQLVVDFEQGAFAFHLLGDQVYLANSAKKQYVVQISDSFLDEMSLVNFCQIVAPLLSSDAPKIVYDVKALRHKLDQMGLVLNNVKHDVCLMQYLVEYRSYKDVESLCGANGYEQIGAGIFAVADKLAAKLVENGVEHLYKDIELPLSDLLYRMEVEGVQIDVELLEQLSKDLHAQLEELTKQIHSLAEENFNVNSPMQLSRILFEKLGLPHGRKTQRGYSTDNEILEGLLDKHPIIAPILEYRKTAKLVGTYIDGIKPNLKGGKVHTTFNQTLTSTGRLSSSEPNLQNIPIRTEFGKEIRKLFVSKYGVFVGADYSQIELRLLAAFSKDETLLNCYRNGQDIHTAVASDILGVPVEMINSNMRRMAKAVNFGIIYGISDYGLSQNAKISVPKAREYIKLYFEKYPTIKNYLDSCVENARRDGYVTTITGRRRQIPEIKSSNFNMRSFGERAAMNMPLQGSAADIMKIAMLKVDEALRKAGLKSKIVLQIHDELIVDCFKEEADQVKAIVKQQMESAVELLCPLIAETEEGANLYEA
ncbi:MAG: DNA polymerase I [Clostridia bacterium]|nr:DNA polymerase I [Clostridia bacterium]